MRHAAAATLLLVCPPFVTYAVHTAPLPQCHVGNASAVVNVSSGVWSIGITDTDGVSIAPMSQSEVHLRLAASNLRAGLHERFAIELLPKVHRTRSLPRADNVTRMILLGLPTNDAYLANMLEARNLMRGGEFANEYGDEGYLLDVQPTSIIVAARTTKGIFAGVDRLLGMVTYVDATGL